VLIANLLMVAGHRGKVSMLPIFLGNYFVASLFSFISLPVGMAFPPGFDLGFGILTGAFFLTNFWVYQKSIVHNGLSLSVGAMRIAMIVPILLAVLMFRESISPINLLGIAIGMTAFSLKANPKELHKLLWIIGLFIISGLTDASLKVYKELGSGNEALFIYIIFSSAFVLTLVAIIGSKLSFGYKSVLFGCMLGIPNRLSTVFFLKALDSIPAAIAYPTVAVSIVLLSIISDIILWKKQITWRDSLLWAMLVISLLLLNLQ
jgi:multidrug transporter EmrE-like cation transporter